MKDLNTIDALFPFEDGYLWAEGPWQLSTKEPVDLESPYFLLPCFSLFESLQWLVPQKWGFLEEASFEAPASPAFASQALEWMPAKPESFLDLVALIQGRMTDNFLEKAVPVYPWKATLEKPFQLSDFSQCFAQRLPGQTPYYLRLNEKQILGVTPEKLFSIKEGNLETQAVAGTIAAAQAESLLSSQKDLREHELVCQYLSAKLESLGSFVRDETKAVIFGKLAHLVTAFTVPSVEVAASGELVKHFHPTPALGVSPRSESNLHFQNEIRERLDVSSFYGAPFGFVWKKQMCFWVGIRNVIIQGKQLTLHTGCGVISESQAQSEWNELLLKREAVCKILNLAT